MSPVRTAPTQLTSRDATLRGQYLTEVIGLLYPPPCSADADDLPARGAVVAQFHVVPDARRPRLLVPAGLPRIAAAAVHDSVVPDARLARLKRNMASAALRTGLSGLLLPDRVQVVRDLDAEPLDTIEIYLAEVLGRDLAVAVHIGPARPSRKPLLQLLTPEGITFGYAKLGTNPLTARLVRLETAALTALRHQAPRDVIVPPLLHAGQWRGHEVLVQGALPTGSRPRPLHPDRLAAAQREIAFGMGAHHSSLASSGYWRQLRERIDAAPPPAPNSPLGSDAPLAADSPAASEAGGEVRAAARALALAGDVLVAAHGDVELTFGAWHGDWTPWNMAVRDYGILVWDWDRFTIGVPVGFDALHHELHERMRYTVDAAEAVAGLLDRAPVLLDPFDVVGADATRLTALLYLIDLATRFLDDKRSGGRLGVLGAWLLPVLLAAVETR